MTRNLRQTMFLWVLLSVSGTGCEDTPTPPEADSTGPEALQDPASAEAEDSEPQTAEPTPGDPGQVGSEAANTGVEQQTGRTSRKKTGLLKNVVAGIERGGDYEWKLEGNGQLDRNKLKITSAREEEKIDGKRKVASLRASDGLEAKMAVRARRVVRGHWNEIETCYRSRLKKHPRLKGNLNIEMSIDNGRVQQVRVTKNTTDDAPLASCAKDRVKRWQFPAEIQLRLTEEYTFSP